MMRDGHVNEQIKREVLQQLKQVVTSFHPNSNGDLKEKVLDLSSFSCNKNESNL